MSPDVESLSIAVKRLQRENSRLKRLAASVLVVIGAALFMGQSHPTRKLECESLALLSPDGSMRATLEAKDKSAQLIFYGSGGKQRLKIESDDNGEGIELKDDSGNILATVSVALQKPGELSTATSTIAALGMPGGPGVVMGATKELAVIRVADKQGHRTWAESSDSVPATGTR